ncbi:hypothetical protein B0H14DRAFT_2822221 [Mycena olivaceomarginata]|nr:hypothetical protein B0H14DRAFT_2822221 [Mycena olivaceomarginata]
MCSEGLELASLCPESICPSGYLPPGLQSPHKVTRAKPCDGNSCCQSVSVTHRAPRPLRPTENYPALQRTSRGHTPSYAMWYAHATFPRHCRVSVHWLQDVPCIASHAPRTRAPSAAVSLIQRICGLQSVHRVAPQAPLALTPRPPRNAYPLGCRPTSVQVLWDLP